ncbi:acetyltransferase-like isoleucine patch superfamily enzyme [Kibdelosporangium banguiense]|uniref:Acetyltransferase-like isoleucine patch superfamily enzyme n=1 Tax=Kibdelosporangium banguiense TaxID=1365924 RepID=A0ABS4TX37_9PSEU|nr:hypothetical protein [Kibdelosporangium banguiense]MBP2328965.1 acetyltransferase-like isoleucine patch superfamily enzyme [Kibdelosporangium banguiense]
MLRAHKLRQYEDKLGNEIVFAGESHDSVTDIRFRGSGNKLIVASDAKIVDLRVDFIGDHGTVEIGSTVGNSVGLRFAMRVGHHSRIRIGRDVSSEGVVLVSAVEGTEVSIGEDTMLFAGIEVRSDDTYPVYEVATEKRLNDSRSITIGEHVWIAEGATIMGGVTIGNGAVISTRSIVDTDIPNNCIAMGAPAQVVNRDIAWERRVVLDRKRGDLLPADGEKTARYWGLTRADVPN